MFKKKYSGIKCLFAGLIITAGTSTLTTGCNGTQKPGYNARLEQGINPDFYQSIQKNRYLSISEKGLAKRVYESIEPNSLNPCFTYQPNPEVSKKWGFVKTHPLTLEEQVYLTKIEEFLPAWDAYQKIKDNNLSNEEKDFLKDMEKTYGKKPSFEKMKEKAGEEFYNLLDSLKILSGKEHLESRDFLFLKEIMDAFVLGTSISSSN